jgi:hypothetical protein
VDSWETNNIINNNNYNNSTQARSQRSRASSTGGEEESPDFSRHRSSSSSSSRQGGGAYVSEEDDIVSSSSFKLPETIRQSMRSLEDLAHEIELLNSGLSAMVDEGHQILDWGPFEGPPNHHNNSDDDSLMSSLFQSSKTVSKESNRHQQHQQLMVQRRLGVLERSARTGAEQAGHAYMAYITTVCQLNQIIDLEVRSIRRGHQFFRYAK